MLNKSLELASRVADYIELGELMALDALQRRESCGGHFARSRKHPKEKPSATTPTSALSPPGSTAAITAPEDASRAVDL